MQLSNFLAVFSVFLALFPDQVFAQDAVQLPEYRRLLRNEDSAKTICENQTVEMIADEAFRFMLKNRGETDRSRTLREFRQAGERYASLGCSRIFFHSVVACIGNQTAIKTNEDIRKAADRLRSCLVSVAAEISPVVKQ